MAQQEEQQKQQGPIENAAKFARMGINVRNASGVGRGVIKIGARFLAPAIAAAAPFMPIAIAVIGVALVVIFVILVAVGIIGGGGGTAFASPGGGLGIKDDYCQEYLSPEDINGDGELIDCSIILRGIILEAAGAAKMPAGVLLGIGLSENLGDAMILSELEISQYSVAGGEMLGPSCATSSAGARGPMQFLPSTFEGHKDFIVDVGARPTGYESKTCNIKDSLYAAAHKLKSDSGIEFDEAARAWIRQEVDNAARAYHGACTIPGLDYCQNVWDFYQNKKDQGVSGDPNNPQGRCPVEGQITSGFRTPSRPDHDGVDIQSDLAIANLAQDIETGESVLSTISGQVDFVGDEPGGYGNYLDIINSNYKTRFAHLANGSILVVEGEQIAPEQSVATEGNTGRSGGTHVHYEIFDSSGENIDPQPFLPLVDNGGVLYCDRSSVDVSISS